MIRCYQCGWSNPDGTDRCQKCGQLIDTGGRTFSAPVVPSFKAPAAVCVKCGYPKSSLLSFCPYCGDGRENDVSDVKSVPPGRDSLETINTLRPPYLVRADGYGTEVIKLEEACEVLIGGVRYIYHSK